MSLQIVRSAFQKKGYFPDTMIKWDDFYLLMTTLSNNEEYDKDVAGEIWAEASKGFSEVKVQTLCQVFVEGQNIIRNKINQCKDQIQRLQKNKREAGAQRNFTIIKEFEKEIKELENDQIEFEDDLRLLTDPFEKNLMSALLRSGRTSNYVNDHYEHFHPQKEYMQGQVQDLKWVLYLSLVYAVIEIIVIYGKYDFLNLIVLTSLLSIYFLSHFDQVFIRLSLGLLVTSEVLDIVWLFMYASQKWNPPNIGNNSSQQISYLRFIVFFTVVLVILKFPLGYFLFKYRNASPDVDYTVSVGFAKILLNANKSNPISRGLVRNIPSLLK